MVDLQTLETVPVFALSLKLRDYLASYLDANKVIQAPNGYWRDWRGIFQLSKLPNQFESFISSKTYPTTELIKILEKEPGPITFADFRYMLGEIDRWDVFDDTNELFVADALEYLKQQERYNRSQQPNLYTTMVETKIPKCLTRDDVLLAAKNLPLQQYAAFILFADQDIKFANQIIEKIEIDFQLKVCVGERDFLAGLTFEHDAIRRLLAERCDRLVVILSPDFVRSELNEYISNLAQSLGIAQRKRKIIPCLYKPCDLPEMFQHIHLLNYEKSMMFNNFWDKLKVSLQPTSREQIVYQCPPNSVTNLSQISVNSLARTLSAVSLPTTSEERLGHQGSCPPNSEISIDSPDRSTSQHRTSATSLQTTSGAWTAHQCPPNSRMDSDPIYSSIGSSLQLSPAISLEATSEEWIGMDPPNSVADSYQLSISEDNEYSTGSSVRSTSLTFVSDSNRNYWPPSPPCAFQNPLSSVSNSRKRYRPQPSFRDKFLRIVNGLINNPIIHKR